MKIKKQFILFAGIFLVTSFSIAQNPEAESTKTVLSIGDSAKIKDSISSAVVNDFKSKISEIERLRKQDSIKKSELEKQLNALKTTDNLKKEELQKQLEGIEVESLKRNQEKKDRIEALRESAVPYPVVGFFNDTLFNIYSKLGSFSALERALAITERIKKIAKDYSLSSDSINIVVVEDLIELLYGDKVVLSISDNDAIWNNTSKTELAIQYKSIITSELDEYNQATSFTTILIEIGLALLVIGILIILIILNNRLFKFFDEKIKDQKGKKLNGLTIKNYTLFDAEKQVAFFSNINKIGKYAALVSLVYIALPILFGIFPWTKNYAETLFGYVFNPLKRMFSSFWEYLPNLFTIVVIYFVFRYVIKAVRFFKTEIERGNLKLSGFYPDWANPTYQILKVILYAFMFVLIFPYLPGSDSPVFQGVSVFLGFLFTFGSAGSLSNVVAGLVLTYMRLFKIGDRVKIGEVAGDVIEKSLLVTRVRTTKNEIISIPNSTVMSSHTINYSSDAPDKGLILHTTVTIGYDVPWKQTHEALIKAANRTDLILKTPPPFVLQTSLDDFYVSYQLNAYTKDSNKQSSIYSEMHQNIQDCFNESGIEILSPHYKAMRDGNHSTIPTDHLPKDYTAPGFNINSQTK